MDPAHDRLTTGMQIGDYLLTTLIYDGPTTRSWLAEQVSIGREVIIDSLNWEQQQDPAYIASFLSDVRAKAAVDYPLIGSVFEAVRDERLCFFAREQLHGETLLELTEAGKKLTPSSVAHILRQLAEANLYLEEHNIDTLPLQVDMVWISEHSLCRVGNMAVGGDRDHTTSTTDKHTLGSALIPLLETDKPGSTRTRSLLDFMIDLEREEPLSWELIKDLSESIELHISQQTDPTEKNAFSAQPQKEKNLGILKATLFGMGIGIAGFAYHSFTHKPLTPKARDLTQMVQIPAGSHTTHDKETVELEAFWIDAHEVTIAEYAEFLRATNMLNAEQLSAYQHPDQPAEKADHLPTDWDNLLQAAKAGTKWNDSTVSLNYPVVGVDWWDAFAYSSYHRRQLPTAEQWHAALSHKKAKKELSRSTWGAVDQASDDLTPTQLYGLAGNVAEWSYSMSKDPSYPTKPKMPIVLGGSFLQSHSNASSREWLNDKSRSTRRADLGFRTLSNKAPTE